MSKNFKPKSSGWVMKHFDITRGKLDKYDELISPKTRVDQKDNKNKYREYQYEDIENLWYIHMLSQMGMQMKEIKKLKSQDEISFREAVIQRIEALEAEKQRIDGMISIAKKCRITGKLPIPRDFAETSFSDFREKVKKEWSCDKSVTSKIMASLADYQLKHPADDIAMEAILARIESECGKQIIELDDDECLELRKYLQIDMFTILEIFAWERQLAQIYPKDISSKEVTNIVLRYCTCMQEAMRGIEYPLSKIAIDQALQFFDGDKSVDIIHRYGKERQEYMVSALLYFSENYTI